MGSINFRRNVFKIIQASKLLKVYRKNDTQHSISKEYNKELLYTFHKEENNHELSLVKFRYKR
jgi:hypothetical protein